MDIITEHFFNKGQTLVFSELKVLSEQIEKLFPKESKETYFCPPTDKQRARGKLLNRVCNESKSRRKSGQLGNLRKKKIMDTVEEAEEIEGMLNYL